MATAAPTAAATSAAPAQETAIATRPATLPQCKTSGQLEVGSDAAYPPFETVNATTGKIEGFDVELLTAITGKVGYTVNFRNALFDTIFTALSYGQYDVVMSATTITEARLQTVNFSNPYFKSGPVIVVREADAATVKGPADLAGKIIGVQAGTTGAEAAKQVPNTQSIREFPTALDAYRALANGDVGAVIDDTAVALTVTATQPELKLAVIGEPLGAEFYGIAVRKDCTELLAKLNQGLGEVIADGTYARIFEKYFGEQPSPEFRAGGRGIVPTAAATTAATSAAAPATTVPTTAATNAPATATTAPTTAPTAAATASS
jgi:polar amino acid transport system substrate-binding protein